MQDWEDLSCMREEISYIVSNQGSKLFHGSKYETGIESHSISVKAYLGLGGGLQH